MSLWLECFLAKQMILRFHDDLPFIHRWPQTSTAQPWKTDIIFFFRLSVDVEPTVHMVSIPYGPKACHLGFTLHFGLLWLCNYSVQEHLRDSKCFWRRRSLHTRSNRGRPVGSNKEMNGPGTEHNWVLLPCLVWPSAADREGWSCDPEDRSSRKWCSAAWWEVVALCSRSRQATGVISEMRWAPMTIGGSDSLITEKTSRERQGWQDVLLRMFWWSLYFTMSVPRYFPLSSSPQSLVQSYTSNIPLGWYGAVIKWPALGDWSHCCQPAAYLSSKDMSRL